jgi:hypothetical protein
MSVDWQVTATTLYCEAVADEVTLLVYPDWSVKCTGVNKYGNSGTSGKEFVKKPAGCIGIDCPVVARYLNKLKNEEENKSTSSGTVK